MNQQPITFYFPIHLYLPNRSGLFVIATAIFIMVVGYFSFKVLIDEIWIMAILSLAMIGYGVYMLIGGVWIYLDKRPRMVIEKQGVQLHGLHRSQNRYIYFDDLIGLNSSLIKVINRLMKTTNLIFMIKMVNCTNAH